MGEYQGKLFRKKKKMKRHISGEPRAYRDRASEVNVQLLVLQLPEKLMRVNSIKIKIKKGFLRENHERST